MDMVYVVSAMLINFLFEHLWQILLLVIGCIGIFCLILLIIQLTVIIGELNQLSGKLGGIGRDGTNEIPDLLRDVQKTLSQLSDNPSLAAMAKKIDSVARTLCSIENESQWNKKFSTASEIKELLMAIESKLSDIELELKHK